MAASVPDSMNIFCPCDDLLQFEEALKTLRRKDDLITNQLNGIIPTTSFQNKVDTTTQCKNLYEQMETNYQEREKAIKHCIRTVSKEVEVLRIARETNMDDDNAIKQLRRSQHKLRQMQKELQIDEVIKNRSLRVFYERCRNAYVPPNRPV